MEENKTLVISIEQLCHLLQIGKNVAYKLLASGEISAFKVGRVWKIPRTSVQSFIDQHSKKISVPLK